jgi:ribosomal protein L29
MEFYEVMGRYRYLYTVMADMAYLTKNYQLAQAKVNEQIQRAKQFLSMASTDSQFAGYEQYLVENIKNLEYRLLTLQMEEAESKGGKKGKIDYIKNTIARLQNTNNPDSIMLSRQLEFLINDLTKTDSLNK